MAPFNRVCCCCSLILYLQEVVVGFEVEEHCFLPSQTAVIWVAISICTSRKEDDDVFIYELYHIEENKYHAGFYVFIIQRGEEHIKVLPFAWEYHTGYTLFKNRIFNYFT